MTEFEKWLKDNEVEYDSEFMGGYHPMGRYWTKLKLGEIRDYRSEAISKFGFAILTQAVIDKLLPYGPFVEVGSGTGYWAYELNRAGGEGTCIASDPHPYKGLRTAPQGTWGNVLELDGKSAVRKYGKDRALLTVWPSYSEGWAAEVLQEYAAVGGQKVAYVGEGSGGCTADDRFHELLDEFWEELENITIPQWWGIHDYLTIYQKNPGKDV